MVDVKTNEVTKVPAAGGRHATAAQDRLQGHGVDRRLFRRQPTRFDPANGEFKVFKLPGPMPTPYGLAVDHDDNVW